MDQSTAVDEMTQLGVTVTMVTIYQSTLRGSVTHPSQTAIPFSFQGLVPTHHALFPQANVLLHFPIPLIFLHLFYFYFFCVDCVLIFQARTIYNKLQYLKHKSITKLRANNSDRLTWWNPENIVLTSYSTKQRYYFEFPTCGVIPNMK